MCGSILLGNFSLILCVFLCNSIHFDVCCSTHSNFVIFSFSISFISKLLSIILYVEYNSRSQLIHNIFSILSFWIFCFDLKWTFFPLIRFFLFFFYLRSILINLNRLLSLVLFKSQLTQSIFRITIESLKYCSCSTYMFGIFLFFTINSSKKCNCQVGMLGKPKWKRKNT